MIPHTTAPRERNGSGDAAAHVRVDSVDALRPRAIQARMERIGDAANDPTHNSASGAERLKKQTGHVRPTYHEVRRGRSAPRARHMQGRERVRIPRPAMVLSLDLSERERRARTLGRDMEQRK
jgi:hypothetical protein